MDDEVGWNDVDDTFADGWRKRLIYEIRPIWLEELYNQDVASREVEANLNVASETARVPWRNSDREIMVPKNVTKNGLVEMVNGLKKALDDGFKEIHEKFDVMDTRVKSVKEYVNFQREKEKWFVDVQNKGFEKQNVDGDEENETGSAEKDEENETEVGDRDEEDETKAGGNDEENETEVGEKDQENEMEVGEKETEEAGEDGGKRMRTYERKRTRKGRRRKEQEGEPSEGGGKRRKKVAVAVAVRNPVMTR